MERVFFNLSGKEYVVILGGISRYSDVLTDSESEILILLLQGKNLQEISASRGVSVNTISNQLSTIYRKSGVRSRQALLRKIHQESLSGMNNEVVS